jgi:mannose-6-phosphate isomerase-like protein (cupin superfamily)
MDSSEPRVVHITPTEVVSEQISVQRVGDLCGAQKLRTNVWTVAEGSLVRHSHREQEELYVILDGVALLEADGKTFKLGERDAAVVPAGVVHQLTNIGAGPMTYLAAAAPAVADDAERQ